ncbi:hypothetical protein D9758_007551 [Tetrapyrgos nigripes]|uniref:Uncharacterized protein n=1 Tax=Tetrapyrgos nigripes TaxID=182062 RepID=A0A8H5LK33_9AGAR|nr:hypothetical protein D9758_007551 [Tetrapyrgos nigripes]
MSTNPLPTRQFISPSNPRSSKLISASTEDRQPNENRVNKRAEAPPALRSAPTPRVRNSFALGTRLKAGNGQIVSRGGGNGRGRGMVGSGGTRPATSARLGSDKQGWVSGPNPSTGIQGAGEAGYKSAWSGAIANMVRNRKQQETSTSTLRPKPTFPHLPKKPQLSFPEFRPNARGQLLHNNEDPDDMPPPTPKPLFFSQSSEMQSQSREVVPRQKTMLNWSGKPHMNFGLNANAVGASQLRGRLESLVENGQQDAHGMDGPREAKRRRLDYGQGDSMHGSTTGGSTSTTLMNGQKEADITMQEPEEQQGQPTVPAHNFSSPSLPSLLPLTAQPEPEPRLQTQSQTQPQREADITMQEPKEQQQQSTVLVHHSSSSPSPPSPLPLTAQPEPEPQLQTQSQAQPLPQSQPEPEQPQTQTTSSQIQTVQIRVKSEERDSLIPRSPTASTSTSSPPHPSSSSSRYSMLTGSHWAHPLPDDCLKTKNKAGWKDARQVWYEREAERLKGKGLKIVRWFFRDDGMTIDWRSPKPVWSDTLLPVDSDNDGKQGQGEGEASTSIQKTNITDTMKKGNNANTGTDRNAMDVDVYLDVNPNTLTSSTPASIQSTTAKNTFTTTKPSQPSQSLYTTSHPPAFVATTNTNADANTRVNPDSNSNSNSNLTANPNPQTKSQPKKKPKMKRRRKNLLAGGRPPPPPPDPHMLKLLESGTGLDANSAIDLTLAWDKSEFTEGSRSESGIGIGAGAGVAGARAGSGGHDNGNSTGTGNVAGRDGGVDTDINVDMDVDGHKDKDNDGKKDDRDKPPHMDMDLHREMAIVEEQTGTPRVGQTETETEMQRAPSERPHRSIPTVGRPQSIEPIPPVSQLDERQTPTQTPIQAHTQTHIQSEIALPPPPECQPQLQSQSRRSEIQETHAGWTTIPEPRSPSRSPGLELGRELDQVSATDYDWIELFGESDVEPERERDQLLVGVGVSVGSGSGPGSSGRGRGRGAIRTYGGRNKGKGTTSTTSQGGPERSILDYRISLGDVERVRERGMQEHAEAEAEQMKMDMDTPPIGNVSALSGSASLTTATTSTQGGKSPDNSSTDFDPNSPPDASITATVTVIPIEIPPSLAASVNETTYVPHFEKGKRSSLTPSGSGTGPYSPPTVTVGRRSALGRKASEVLSGAGSRTSSGSPTRAANSARASPAASSSMTTIHHSGSTSQLADLAERLKQPNVISSSRPETTTPSSDKADKQSVLQTVTQTHIDYHRHSDQAGSLSSTPGTLSVSSHSPPASSETELQPLQKQLSQQPPSIPHLDLRRCSITSKSHSSPRFSFQSGQPNTQSKFKSKSPIASKTKLQPKVHHRSSNASTSSLDCDKEADKNLNELEEGEDGLIIVGNFNGSEDEPKPEHHTQVDVEMRYSGSSNIANARAVEKGKGKQADAVDPDNSINSRVTLTVGSAREARALPPASLLNPLHDRQKLKMERLALEFLKQFVLTFDNDRSALESAYTGAGIFSCTVHQLHPLAGSDLSTSAARRFAAEVLDVPMPIQGSSKIGQALRSLGRHEFFPRDSTLDLDYDLLYLGHESTASLPPSFFPSTSPSPSHQSSPNDLSILLTAHSQLVIPFPGEPSLDQRVAIDQTFLLIKPENKVAKSTGTLTLTKDGHDWCGWPLDVLSHQMVVRDVPWLPANKLRKVMPWLDEVIGDG